MFPNSLIKSIVLVATILSVLTPTMMAGIDDFLGSVINTCQYSICDNNPKCAAGYDTLSTTREGCPGFTKKNYCCPSGMGPQCLFTDCSREASCQGNYRELDRTRTGCSGFAEKAYCCKTTNLPFCFDMTCPAFSESAKSCPAEYRETKRAKGRSAGCDSAFAERLTCCLPGDTANNRVQNSNTNRNSDSEVISETKTITLEDGTVQTVTRTKSHSKSTSGGIFGSSDTTYAAFFRILLLFPIFVPIL